LARKFSFKPLLLNATHTIAIVDKIPEELKNAKKVTIDITLLKEAIEIIEALQRIFGKSRNKKAILIIDPEAPLLIQYPPKNEIEYGITLAVASIVVEDD